MILSVSRRTDIPAYFSEWFINRLKKGYVYTRNPMNHRQVSKINLTTEYVDLIVFWTKNPEPMIDHLDDLEPYPYYFQVSITPYDKDLESGLPSKDMIIESFIKLSKIIGKEKMVWRYDPVLISNDYSLEDHMRDFENYARRLAPYCHKCVIAFFDHYSKLNKVVREKGIRSPVGKEIDVFLQSVKRVKDELNLMVESCSESLDMTKYGIGKGSCIDLKMIQNILGESVDIKRDTGQREICNCVKSIDIGIYNTCLNGCVYCYANYSKSSIETQIKKHNVNSPLLIGELEEEDQLYERKLEKHRTGQIRLEI